MRILLLCFALLLSSSLVFSQSVSGVVKNDRSEPLAGATVHLKNVRDSLIGTVATRANGQFRIENRQQGSFILSVEAVGQLPLRINIEISGDTSINNIS